VNDTTYIGSDGAPGGAGGNTQVVFNDNGSLAGDSGLTYNKTTDALSSGAFVPTGSTVPTNGVYRPSANNVAISTNGTGKIFIDSNGNLGIGTLSNISPGGYGYAKWFGFTGATSGDSSIAVDLRGSRTVPGGFADINFWHQSTSNRAYIQARRGSSDSAIDLDFITSGGAGMRLDSSGRLGLGTSSPGASFHLSNGGGEVEFRLGNSVTTDHSRIYTSSNDLFISNQRSANLILRTGATERARIDSSGRLLVGTTSTSTASTITVQGNSSSPTGVGIIRACIGTASPGTNDELGAFTIGDTAHTGVAAIIGNRDGGTWSASSKPTRLVFSTTADGASIPTERMRIDNKGASSLFGSSTTASVLSSRSVHGGGTTYTTFEGFRNATSTTDGTATFAVYTNGTYATLSDQNQKKNIETTRDGYLEDLKRLRVVKYNWNEQSDGEPKELGLIAQEVESVFPALISELSGDEGPVKGIKAGVFTYMLIKALQEATQRIETLEAEVAALKTQ